MSDRNNEEGLVVEPGVTIDVKIEVSN